MNINVRASVCVLLNNMTCTPLFDFELFLLKVDVTLHDGRTFVGTVVNADLHSDIAIVKITSSTPLPSAKLGSSCKLDPGDWVVAMGCPRSLQHTITAGIVRYPKLFNKLI